MYKKFIKNIVKKTMENYFIATVYKVEVTYRKDVDMVDFTAKVLKDSTSPSYSYGGYIGSIGQIVITRINNRHLNAEDYITIN